jgi:hypothetical protein
MKKHLRLNLLTTYLPQNQLLKSLLPRLLNLIPNKTICLEDLSEVLRRMNQ